jgi:hypothetical protein
LSKRETLLDKTITALEDEIRVLMLAREKLLAQRNKADLAAARPPALKTVSK